MSRLDTKVQCSLLKEAKMYFKDIKPVDKVKLEDKKDSIVLTQDHILEWLQVFYDDKIMMGTCNEATVKQ